jgi:hypothetical protein
MHIFHDWEVTKGEWCEQVIDQDGIPYYITHNEGKATTRRCRECGLMQRQYKQFSPCGCSIVGTYWADTREQVRAKVLK